MEAVLFQFLSAFITIKTDMYKIIVWLKAGSVIFGQFVTAVREQARQNHRMYENKNQHSKQNNRKNSLTRPSNLNFNYFKQVHT